MSTAQILTPRSKLAACKSAIAKGRLGVVADMLGLVRLEATGAETPGQQHDFGGSGQVVVHVGIHLVGFWLRGYVTKLKIGWRSQQDSPSFILLGTLIRFMLFFYFQAAQPP
ncbi:hypothetical protein LY78DRAFT_49930 [Colletotrichum sublineola]|nr:hypothetical protein LY78DRAFT_49930 [Colletotrichum sublineola]